MGLSLIEGLATAPARQTKFESEMRSRLAADLFPGDAEFKKFAQLQIDAARGEVEGLAGSKIDALEREADHLQRRHPQWIPNSPLWRRIVKKYQFFGARIERVVVGPEDFLTHGDEIFWFSPCVRHLDLPRRSKIPPGFFAAASLHRLHSLSADDCRVDDAGVASLSGSQLRWVSFVNSSISEQGLVHLANLERLPELQYANLAGNRHDPLEPAITDGSDAIDVRQSQHLRELEARVARKAGRSGPTIPWFHRTGWPRLDNPPNRFLMRYGIQYTATY
jgi:hypothetical protein